MKRILVTIITIIILSNVANAQSKNQLRLKYLRYENSDGERGFTLFY